jgi:hypothetical protein
VISFEGCFNNLDRVLKVIICQEMSTCGNQAAPGKVLFAEEDNQKKIA